MTERILAAAQRIIPGTERSLSATERLLAVASIILCRIEKTVSLTDFIPDARGIMSAKPSRIAGETEIIIGEASINPSGLEMIDRTPHLMSLWSLSFGRTLWMYGSAIP